MMFNDVTVPADLWVRISAAFISRSVVDVARRGGEQFGAKVPEGPQDPSISIVPASPRYYRKPGIPNETANRQDKTKAEIAPAR
jgi:hypothetical protein